MPVLRPVTSTYLANLIFEIKECHSSKGVEYLEKLARGKNYEKCLDDLEFLSDAIFYLEMFELGTHDTKYVHWIKEKAMHICAITEEQLTASSVDNPILLENGGLLLTEDGLYYLQLEI